MAKIKMWKLRDKEVRKKFEKMVLAELDEQYVNTARENTKETFLKAAGETYR